MKEIPLTKGQVALVDDSDYWNLMQYNWYAQTASSGGFYAARRDSSNRTIYMHNFLTGFKETDHIDGNKLNNQLTNLREANRSLNMANVQKRNTQTTSKYKGVYRTKGKWKAGIEVDYVKIHLGTFATEEDAARKYDQAALMAFGEFAVLNFPEST